MNRLSTKQRARILSLLVEGMSMRSIERHEGVSIVTIARLLQAAGRACSAYHDQHVRGIRGKRSIQCDEIWSFVYAKEKRAPFVIPWDVAGTVWAWMAIDADSKLLVSYLLSQERGTEAATALFADLVSRLNVTPHITTDELKSYRAAARRVFGRQHRQVLSQMRKGKDTGHTTSFIERRNLTTRTTNRRYARKTNAFSKKFARHIAMMHLSLLHYNFCRIHMSLRVTPAMEAGIDPELHDLEWIVGLIDAAAPQPKKPGPAVGSKYRPRKKVRQKKESVEIRLGAVDSNIRGQIEFASMGAINSHRGSAHKWTPPQEIIMRTRVNYGRSRRRPLLRYTFKEIREANERDKRRAVDRIYRAIQGTGNNS